MEGWWVVFASFGFALVSQSFGLQAIDLLSSLLANFLNLIGRGRTIFFTCSGVRGDLWGMLGFDAAAGGGVDGRSLMVIFVWCIEGFRL